MGHDGGIGHDGAGPGIFNMNFGVIFDDYYAKLLFLEGRLGAGLCLPPNFEVILIFPNFLRLSKWSSNS